MAKARKYQYIARKNTLYELLLEGSAGAGEMDAGGGEGAGAVHLGDWCVLDKKVCWSNDLGEEQCTTAREPGGSFAVRAIALSK